MTTQETQGPQDASGEMDENPNHSSMPPYRQASDMEAIATVLGVLADGIEQALESYVSPAPTFNQRWLRLCPDDETGAILISEVASVMRTVEFDSSMRGAPKRGLADRGVFITLRSGVEISAPDAVYAEVMLSLMAAEVGQ